MATIKLNGITKSILDWEELDADADISTQTDAGIASAQVKYSYGSGLNQANESWYREVSVSSNESYNVDLTSLPVNMVYTSITKSISTLKVLTIENTSESGKLVVGNSGVSNGVQFIGYASEIGNSGVFHIESKIGIPVTSTKKSLVVKNISNNTLTFKILVLGVQ